MASPSPQTDIKGTNTYMVGRFVTGRFEAMGSFVVGTLLIRGIYCRESLVLFNLFLHSARPDK
jgi:hypothetical protein